MPPLPRRLQSLFRRGTPARQRTSMRTDRVAPWLFIGPALPGEGYALLREQGVTHVVDLREEERDDEAALTALGLRWRQVPIPDRFPPSAEQLAELLAWFDAELPAENADGEERAVLLHCHAGLTRTPTVAIALLMHRGYTLAEAHRLVFAARPEVTLSPPQLAWLDALEAAKRAGA